MEKRSSNPRRLARHTTRIVAGFLTLFSTLSTVWSQNLSPREERSAFSERVASYVNGEIRPVLNDMAVREQYLLQLVENITQELEKRGTDAIRKDELGIQKLAPNTERLVVRYAAELRRVLAVLAEIDSLQQVLQKQEAPTLLRNLSGLRRRTEALLDASSPEDVGRPSNLARAYRAEIDSLITLYRRLEALRGRVGEKRPEVEQAIQAREDSLVNLLKLPEEIPSRPVAEDYLAEVQRVIEVLEHLDRLQEVAPDVETALQVEEVRRRLLDAVDARLLAVLGYDAHPGNARRTLAELLDEWKRAYYADYSVHLARAQLMYTSLLKQGTADARTRMLKRALRDALGNYRFGNYALAQRQFTAILTDYSGYVSRLGAVYFYRGECLYAQSLYGRAWRDYETIAKRFPSSQYLGEALFRLLRLSDKMGETEEFDATYQRFLSDASRFEAGVRNKGHYLAGYVFFKRGKLSEAEAALSRVDKTSPYSHRACFLLASVLAGQRRFPEAIQVFEQFAGKGSRPWTGGLETFLRNAARLRLGYIYYEQGDYARAREAFTSVSPGFAKYDQSLLGAAWASYQLEDYRQAVVLLDRLIATNPTSSSLYEARVLAAECQRSLGNTDEALANLRYVTNAQDVLNYTDEYNQERRKLLDLLGEVERIQKQAVEQQDSHAFELGNAIRAHLQDALASFHYRSRLGSVALRELKKERAHLFELFDRLARLSAEADSAGVEEFAERAARQEQLLMQVLELHGNPKRATTFFGDYVLAGKEGFSTYENDLRAKLTQELKTERMLLQARLAAVRQLREQHAGSAVDLDLVADVFRHLDERAGQLAAWLADHPPEELQTDYQRWASVAGYSMSDISYARLQERSDEIGGLARNLVAINQVMEGRAEILRRRLSEFDEQIRLLERRLRDRQMEVQRQEQEQYFEKKYFDDSQREVPGTPERAEPK